MFPAQTWMQMHEQRLVELRSEARARDTAAVPPRTGRRLPRIKIFRRVAASGVSA